MTAQPQGLGAPGYFEPEVSRQFLPGCWNCGGSHPLARKGYQGDVTKCPDCGQPAGTPSRVMTEKAILGGFTPSVLVARALLWAGRSLSKISQRIR